MYIYNVWRRCSLRACDGKTELRAAKTSSYIALVCSPSLRFARRMLRNCTNDRKSQGVRSSTLYNTLRTRQFPHMHNSVSSLIACEDTIMCKGGNGLARSVLHVSHYKTRQNKTKQNKTTLRVWYGLYEPSSCRDKRSALRKF